MPKEANILSTRQVELVNKLRDITLERLHITVTDVNGDRFGSANWAFIGMGIPRHFCFIQKEKESGILAMGLVTDRKEEITFTCRTCLDKAIAQPLELTLPRGVVAIVQGYL